MENETKNFQSLLLTLTDHEDDGEVEFEIVRPFARPFAPLLCNIQVVVEDEALLAVNLNLNDVTKLVAHLQKIKEEMTKFEASPESAAASE